MTINLRGVIIDVAFKIACQECGNHHAHKATRVDTTALEDNPAQAAITLRNDYVRFMAEVTRDCPLCWNSSLAIGRKQ